MTVFILKIIAYFFMFVDHIKFAFPSTYNDFTLYFGRIAFPIFVFCTVEGYKHTKDFTKYAIRLLIFAILSQIPFSLFNSLPTLNQPDHLNVIFTLAIGVIALKCWDEIPNNFFKILSVVLLGAFAEYLKTDYGFWGVFFIFIIYIGDTSKINLALSYLSAVLIKYAVRLIYWEEIKNIKLDYAYTFKMCACTLIPIIFILLYNGKSGTKKLNKFFYYIYPIHLLLFWLFSPYTFNLLNL